MKQMMVKAGIWKHGEDKAVKTLFKELSQLDCKKVFGEFVAKTLKK